MWRRASWLTEPFEHDYNVFGAHFSPDGKFLMTLGASPLAPYSNANLGD